jgi:SpoIIAA-like
VIELELRSDIGVLIIKPLGPLAVEDFAAIARDADDYIESHGVLNGLMICSKKFRGWKNAQGLWAHLRFVCEHHRKIKKVAFVSNSIIPELVINIAKYFVHPEAKYFKYNQEGLAMQWIGAI